MSRNPRGVRERRRPRRWIERGAAEREAMEFSAAGSQVEAQSRDRDGWARGAFFNGFAFVTPAKASER